MWQADPAGRPPAAEPPPRTALDALAQGWRLWGRAPLPILVVAWLPLAGSVLLSLLPGIGGLVSTLASGALGVVTWLCLDAAARGADAAPGAAFAAAGRRRPVLLAMALVALLFGIALALVTAPVAGVPVLQVVLSGLPVGTEPTPRLLQGALLVAPIGWLLQWMAPRMLLAGRSAPQAAADCFAAVARRPALLLGFAALSVVLVVLGLLTVVGIGLVLPWLTASSYAVYRGLFEGPAGDGARVVDGPPRGTVFEA